MSHTGISNEQLLARLREVVFRLDDVVEVLERVTQQLGEITGLRLEKGEQIDEG